MKSVIQRVSQASVSVQGHIIGKIEQGLCVLLGIEANDTLDDVIWMTQKINQLRIFEDATGKMNLNIQDINGSILLISQFTLLADCTGGRRPSFTKAGPPSHAAHLYEETITLLKQTGIPVEQGIFGAHMRVQLINDGPATFILESKKR